MLVLLLGVSFQRNTMEPRTNERMNERCLRTRTPLHRARSFVDDLMTERFELSAGIPIRDEKVWFSSAGNIISLRIEDELYHER